MMKKMPTYSICNLLGADRCMAEIAVMRLQEFVRNHRDIQFPHRHDFYQIVLFTSDGGTHAIDFQQYPVEQRQVYYMAPGQIHTWDFDETADGYIVNFNASFFGSVFQHPNYVKEFSLFNNISGSPVNTLSEEHYRAMEPTFAQMLREFESGADFVMDILRGLLTIVLVRLSRLAPTAYRENTSAYHLTQMRQFEQLIEQHFREKHLPKAYAEMMFVTPNHLNALVNSAMGKSAGEIIRDRILLEAKRMLANSDMMVGQIAESLHFEDNAYFTRFFKKYVSTTPENFRLTCRQVNV